jgi:phosphoserine aminotransferase
MSSDILWRPIDVSKFGLLYAGAQKNVGCVGVTVVIAKKSLVEAGREDIPKIFR